MVDKKALLWAECSVFRWVECWAYPWAGKKVLQSAAPSVDSMAGLRAVRKVFHWVAHSVEPKADLKATQ